MTWVSGAVQRHHLLHHGQRQRPELLPADQSHQWPGGRPGHPHSRLCPLLHCKIQLLPSLSVPSLSPTLWDSASSYSVFSRCLLHCEIQLLPVLSFPAVSYIAWIHLLPILSFPSLFYNVAYSLFPSSVFSAFSCTVKFDLFFSCVCTPSPTLWDTFCFRPVFPRTLLHGRIFLSCLILLSWSALWDSAYSLSLFSRSFLYYNTRLSCCPVLLLSFLDFSYTV